MGLVGPLPALEQAAPHLGTGGPTMLWWFGHPGLRSEQQACLPLLWGSPSSPWGLSPFPCLAFWGAVPSGRHGGSPRALPRKASLCSALPQLQGLAAIGSLGLWQRRPQVTSAALPGAH